MAVPRLDRASGRLSRVPSVNFLGVDAAAADGATRARSSDDSIAAYDAIAEEYDSPQHRTTGELGRLSRRAVCEAPIEDVFSRSNALIVELGCGTGAFTAELVRRMHGGQLLITDPSMRMLRRAVRHLADGTAETGAISSLALCASAAETLPRLAVAPDLIAAGLADPYLSDSLFRDARRCSTAFTRVLVTVPTRRWAIAERQGRLRIPLDQTRFRTRKGHTVHSRSLTLDPDELASSFSANGFQVVAHGAIEANAGDWNPRPEIAWALGRPTVATAPAQR